MVRSVPLALSRRSPRVQAQASAGNRKKVLVTGAGGRTGSLVLKKLAQRKDEYEVRGMVRTEKSRQKLRKEVPEGDAELVVGNVSSAEDVSKAMAGCDQLVVASSATPRIQKRSILKIMFKKLVKQDPGRPTFRWPPQGTPEEVDYIGGKNQIDAAKKERLEQVVWIGSMGGTQKDNFLNTIGDGNILLWKRKAEQYLMSSGLKYTIIHPGGLLDKAGGKRELKIAVDDEILSSDKRAIPRDDVASVAVACLGLKAAQNMAFDLASKDEEGGEVELNIVDLLKSLRGKSCNYRLNKESVDALTPSV